MTLMTAKLPKSSVAFNLDIIKWMEFYRAIGEVSFAVYLPNTSQFRDSDLFVLDLSFVIQRPTLLITYKRNLWTLNKSKTRRAS